MNIVDKGWIGATNSTTVLQTLSQCHKPFVRATKGASLTQTVDWCHDSKNRFVSPTSRNMFLHFWFSKVFSNILRKCRMQEKVYVCTLH